MAHHLPSCDPYLCLCPFGAAGQLSADQPLLVPIEDVFNLQGVGTMVTGTIETGTLNVGDVVELLGFRTRKTFVVTTMEADRTTLSSAEAGKHVGIALRGALRSDIRRGMVLATPGSLRQRKAIAVRVTFLRRVSGPDFLSEDERSGRLMAFVHGTDVPAEWYLPDDLDALNVRVPMTLYLDLQDPVALDRGFPIILRSGGRSLGTATVTDVFF